MVTENSICTWFSDDEKIGSVVDNIILAFTLFWACKPYEEKNMRVVKSATVGVQSALMTLSLKFNLPTS